MKKYVYMIEEDYDIENPGMRDRLNELGEIGWELVATTPINKNGWTVRVSYTLKKSDEDE